MCYRQYNGIGTQLDDASLAKIDALVQAGVFKSRSRAGHFLMIKGILAQTELLDQVMERLAKIKEIQSELNQLFEGLEEA